MEHDFDLSQLHLTIMSFPNLLGHPVSTCLQYFGNNMMLFSFNKLHLQMEELEQKHLHLLQVVESEKTAKWQYTQHCEELTEEIKKLRTEVNFNRASPSSLVCFFFYRLPL